MKPLVDEVGPLVVSVTASVFAECIKLRDDLADLQAEISIKERLVMELEQSERRLAEVLLHYLKYFMLSFAHWFSFP